MARHSKSTPIKPELWNEHLKTNTIAVMKAEVETEEWNMQVNEYHQNMLKMTSEKVTKVN